MDKATQERWLTDLSFNDFAGERLDDEDQRRKYQRNFQKLQTLPNAHEAIEFFREYVKRCIPAPFQTEPYYWSSSCLPGKGKTLYIRVNIKQEVLRIVNHGNQLNTTFFVAQSELSQDKVLNKIWGSIKNFMQFKAIPTVGAIYEAGGQDQVGIAVFGIENAQKILNDEKFLYAIRLLNLRIMRKTFNLQYRYHCYALADSALEPIYDNN